MSRWHAVKNLKYRIGIDSLIKERGIQNVRFIDFIGGLSSYSDRKCKGMSSQKEALKEQYFYKEGFPYESTVKSFQVHLPEKRINNDGSFQW